MTKLEEFYKFMLPFFNGYRISSEVKDFIICQFALESDFGKSSLAIRCSNYCGMREPLVRLTKSIGKDVSTGFATYALIQDCVDDYFLCLQYHKPLSDVWQYVKSFKSFIYPWYCPEVNYIDKITKLFNQLKSIQNV